MSEEFNVPNFFTPVRVNPISAPMKFVPTNKVTFIWGESCCGQKKDGPQVAPPLVCSDEFLSEVIKPMGWDVNISRVPQVFEPTPDSDTSGAYQPFCVSATCGAIATAVEKAGAEGTLPVMIGGDHCLSMGSALGASRRFGKGKFCVIWFDAHADINTIESSPTGNIHGMPVAALIGLPGMKRSPAFADGQFTCLDHKQVGWIGLRDVDEGEEATLKALGVKTALRMSDLQRDGIAKNVETILNEINPNRDLPIHISFDVDGMDPIDAPATGTPVDRGVRLHEAIEFIRIVRQTGLLASIDVVEVNPSLAKDAREVATTVDSARWIIAQALGRVSPSTEEQKK